MLYVIQIDQSTAKASERDIFAQWLGSVVQQIPSQYFRSFQSEVFGLSLKYLQSVSTDAARTTEPTQMIRTGYGSQFHTMLPMPMQQLPPTAQSFIPQPYVQSSISTALSIIAQAYSVVEDSTNILGDLLSTDAGNQDKDK